MKRIKKNQLQTVITVMLCLIVSNAFAQTNDWEWSTYKLKFSIFEDCQATTNNSEEFTADCEGISISIFPWIDDEVSVDELANAVIAIAEELDYDEISEASDIELNDFEGVMIEGVKDGVNAVIIGLLDPTSSTNFYSVIIYEDGMEDDAAGIALSFEKM